MDFIAPINARLIKLPDNPTLVDQLRRLERRRGRLGKDSIDHPVNGHDDSANSVAGCCWLLLNEENKAASTPSSYLCLECGTMTAYSHNKYNVALTTRSPFGAVLARRHFTGSIIVGGAWQSERSIQAVLDELKARLKKELGQNWLKAGVIALIEDSEAGRALADLAENAIPLGWTYVYQPIEVIRQSLERLYFVSRGRQLPSCRLMRIALARGNWRTH